MKFQSKKHATLALKKKSGETLSAEDQKELDTLNAKSEADKKAEDEAAKKAADDAAAKAEEDKKKEEDAAAAAKAEEDKKKPAPEKKEGEADPTAEGQVTLESLNAAISKLTENMGMLMDAFATMMDAGAPAEEAKEGDKGTDGEKEVEVEVEEDDNMDEEEMEKELEKTIAELEALENA